MLRSRRQIQVSPSCGSRKMSSRYGPPPRSRTQVWCTAPGALSSAQAAPGPMTSKSNPARPPGPRRTRRPGRRSRGPHAPASARRETGPAPSPPRRTTAHPPQPAGQRHPADATHPTADPRQPPPRPPETHSPSMPSALRGPADSRGLGSLTEPCRICRDPHLANVTTSPEPLLDLPKLRNDRQDAVHLTRVIARKYGSARGGGPHGHGSGPCRCRLRASGLL
jgi:hypothetical protein